MWCRLLGVLFARRGLYRLLIGCSFLLTAMAVDTATATSVHPSISLTKLQSAIFAGLHQVHEFQTLAEQAQKLDIKAIYLFGGTAAALAHYAWRDLERQRTYSTHSPAVDTAQPSDQQAPLNMSGPMTSYALEFNYNLRSVLFYNQDIDIVVDTHDNQKIQQLEAAVKTALPMDDLKWDFWGLNIDYKNRPALLTSPDFAHQHTDSHSTVLIPVYLSPTPSLSGPASSHSIYDLRSDDATQFLTDVLEKQLSCYYSAKHRQSPRYKKGDNPEIFFAIRTLTKAFQYGLDIPGNCMNRIQKIFKNFKADRDLKTRYSQYWIEKYAKKLYTTSIDLERSQRVLQQLGALKVLKSIKGNTDEMNSMAWWLNRQPLLSRPINPASSPHTTGLPQSLGQKTAFKKQDVAAVATNKTAEQLGLRYVVHSTQTRTAYESIMRSHNQQPNAFISRKDQSGESAAMGDGFYTSVVDSANVCSNEHGLFGICFYVHPQARQYDDYHIDGDIVVFKNKSALTIVNDGISKAATLVNNYLAQDGDMNLKIQRLVSNNMFKEFMPFFLQSQAGETDLFAFMDPILKSAQTLKAKKYAAFLEAVLPYLPRQYINLNYKNFIHPKLNTLLHNIFAKGAGEGKKKTKKEFRRHLDNIALLDIYADDEALERIKFKRQHLKSLPSYHLAQNYGRLMPTEVISAVNNMKALVKNKTAMSFEERKKGLDTLLKHLHSLDEHYKLYVKTLKFAGIRLKRPLRKHHELYYKSLENLVHASPWFWLLEMLLPKLENTPLHKLSYVKTDILFETLLMRALFQATILPTGLVMNFFEPLPAEVLPTKLAQLFENNIVDNVDYFIRHNNVLVLRGIARYILSDMYVATSNKRPPSDTQLQKRFNILEKIINYETNLQPSTLANRYSVRSDYTIFGRGEDAPRPTTTREMVYETNHVMRISIRKTRNKQLNNTLDKIPVAIDGNTAYDVVYTLSTHQANADIDQLWARHKGSERLFKLIHKVTAGQLSGHEYSSDMLSVLMRRHWNRQPWALDFVERLVSEAISSVHSKRESLQKRQRNVHGSISVVHTFLRRLNPNDSIYANLYDHEHLHQQPQMLQLLEQAIGHTCYSNWFERPPEDVLDDVMDSPVLREYFARRYDFDAHEEFSVLQLHQKIQKHQQKPVCAKLLSAST